MTFSSDSSSLYTSTAQFGPYASPLLMQHFRPTLAFKPLIPFPLTSYLFPLHSHYRLMLLDISFYLLLPLLFRDSFRGFNGMLEVSKTEALNFYALFRLIPLTLFVYRNLTLTCLPFSGSLDSLPCDLIAFTLGLVFFLLMSHTLEAASSFSSGRTYPSLNFLLPLFLLSQREELPRFLRLTPTMIT